MLGGTKRQVWLLQAGVKGAGLGPGSEQQQQEQQEKQAEVKAKHIGTNTMGMVLDLLCFCVQHHGYRSLPLLPCQSLCLLACAAPFGLPIGAASAFWLCPCALKTLRSGLPAKMSLGPDPACSLCAACHKQLRCLMAFISCGPRPCVLPVNWHDQFTDKCWQPTLGPELAASQFLVYTWGCLSAACFVQVSSADLTDAGSRATS